MNICVTDGNDPVLSVVAEPLAARHAVTTMDGVDVRVSDQVAPRLAGVDGILHAVPRRAEGESDEDLLDRASRGPYVLMEGALKAGLGRAVLISRLDLFDDYPADYVIDESWRPNPRPDADGLAPLLAERTFREYARQHDVVAICLRFGEIDREGGTPLGLAVEAVERALTVDVDEDGYRWRVFHVAESDRFPLRGARSAPLSLGGEN